MEHAETEITRTYRSSPSFRSALKELIEADSELLQALRRLINEPGGDWPLGLRDEPEDETTASAYRITSFLLDVAATREISADHVYEEILALAEADGVAPRAPDQLRALLDLDPRAEEARDREVAQHLAMATVNHVEMTLDYRVDDKFGSRTLRPVVLLTLLLDETRGGDAAITVQIPSHALTRMRARLEEIQKTAAEVEEELVRAGLAKPTW